MFRLMPECSHWKADEMLRLFKTTRKRRKLIVLPALALYLFVATWLQSGAIMCIGSDGHISLETAPLYSCNTTYESITELTVSQGSSLYDFDDGSHCGPCVDVPVKISLSRNRIASRIMTPQVDVFHHIAPIFAFLSFFDQPSLKKNFESNLPLFSDTTLYSLSTVIMLS
jgi:hypothetical protein